MKCALGIRLTNSWKVCIQVLGVWKNESTHILLKHNFWRTNLNNLLNFPNEYFLWPSSFGFHYLPWLGMLHVCAQLCPTVCHPMDCSPCIPLSMEFSRQEYYSRLLFPPLGDLPNPQMEPTSHTLLDSLPLEPLGLPIYPRDTLK